MRGVLKHIITCIFILLLTASCNHKEFCYYHQHNTRVRINVDWSRFSQDTPTGMTVMVYPAQGGEPFRHLTNTTSHAYVHLPVGYYHTITFNQSEGEIGSVTFKGMDRYETAAVISNSTKSAWYKTKAEDEKLAEGPDWIGTDRQEGAEVTQEMLDGTAEYTLAQANMLMSRAPMEDYIIAEHTPENIIYTITVKVHIKGFQNLRSARASLTGLAEGYFLGKGRYTESIVTQLLENWTATVDPDDPTIGTISTSMRCFGLPDGHNNLPEENQFNLTILLADNVTKVNKIFQVGDKFTRDSETEVNLSLNLNLELWLDEPLPDVIPEGSVSSGFDAKVDDWGEEIDYEIGI